MLPFIVAVIVSYLAVFILGTYFGMEWLMPVYVIVTVFGYLYMRARSRP